MTRGTQSSRRRYGSSYEGKDLKCYPSGIDFLLIIYATPNNWGNEFLFITRITAPYYICSKRRRNIYEKKKYIYI